MKFRILNQAEAEQYASKLLEDYEDYSFLGKVDAKHEDPETVFEQVNRHTYLKIQGLTELGKEFDEDRFSLDTVKYDYFQDLSDTVSLCQVLQENGIKHQVEISVETSGGSPKPALDQLQGKEVHPAVNTRGTGFETKILYTPDNAPVFRPRVHPGPGTAPKEAQEREKELEELVDDL